ncbi:hypothetical protein ACFVU2_19965 [Leifsonia sp. NPDC058194]|uniref:hypothetical protein n=1 Tax=Leifsonia sp. NPDC058194 TaxID=3346374 RepID=UPI0036D7C312
MNTQTEQSQRLDADEHGRQTVIGSHWATGFPSRRGLEELRNRDIRNWLRVNAERARDVAARIGEPRAVADGTAESGAELHDVIHMNNYEVGAAVRDALVFRGWGSQNLFRPDMAGPRFSGEFASSLREEVFDHRFLEAYDDGAEPMFVSYPYVLNQVHRPLLSALARMGWNIAISPYGNRVRNEGLRLSFSEYLECEEHVRGIERARFTIEADEWGGAILPTVTAGPGKHVVSVDSPDLFDAVLSGLLIDASWVTVRTDEGGHPLRPSLEIWFHEATHAEAFIQTHLARGEWY